MPWLLLDRDGTLCVRHHYLTDPADVKLLPGVGKALQKAQMAGIRLAVVTNQSVISRGIISPAQLNAIHDALGNLLSPYSVELEYFFVCPHAPQDRCDCRKPQIGLLQQFERELGGRPCDSVLVGDSPSDLLAAKRWGCRSVAIYGSLFASEPEDSPWRPSAGLAIELAIEMLSSAHEHS